MKMPYRLKFYAARRGTSLVSYGILTGLVSLVAIGAVTNLGSNIRGIFQGARASVALDDGGHDGPPGEAQFTTQRVHTWTIPEGLTKISAVVVGPGGGGSTRASTVRDTRSSFGGGGGGLAYTNAYTIPEDIETLTVTVGTGGKTEISYQENGDKVIVARATGGASGAGSGTHGDVTFSGGSGGSDTADYDDDARAGGGQAAGYGFDGLDSTNTSSGGGVGILCSSQGERTETSDENWYVAEDEYAFGGGGKAVNYGPSNRHIDRVNDGGDGAARIIWGSDRAFPSSNCRVPESAGNVISY